MCLPRLSWPGPYTARLAAHSCGTSMNRTSSRSHALLMIRVEQMTECTKTPAPAAAGSQTPLLDAKSAISIKKGLLTIVDLAGSERKRAWMPMPCRPSAMTATTGNNCHAPDPPNHTRAIAQSAVLFTIVEPMATGVCKSGSDGQRLEEAKRINRSIAALGNCIAALGGGGGGGRAAHVPFRDSKLTRLLTDSLGGNTKTSLCASVGPALHNYDETFCTLLLATRAMCVKTVARVNERVERPDTVGPQRQVRHRS